MTYSTDNPSARSWGEPVRLEGAIQGADTDVLDLIGHQGLLWVAAARFVLELFDLMNAPLAEDAASEFYALVNVRLFAFAGLEAAETDDAGLLALTEPDVATIRLERFARCYRGTVDRGGRWVSA